MKKKKLQIRTLNTGEMWMLLSAEDAKLMRSFGYEVRMLKPNGHPEQWVMTDDVEFLPEERYGIAIGDFKTIAPVCPRCDARLYRSMTRGYSWACPRCAEDFYRQEVEDIDNFTHIEIL